MTSKVKFFIHRSCMCKNKYDSFKVAMEKMLEKYPNGADSCYKCVVCGKYHIGHYPKKQVTRWRNKIKNYIQYQKEMKDVINFSI